MSRVLMVEDNPAILESIELDLQMRGYEVMTRTAKKLIHCSVGATRR